MTPGADRESPGSLDRAANAESAADALARQPAIGLGLGAAEVVALASRSGYGAGSTRGETPPAAPSIDGGSVVDATRAMLNGGAAVAAAPPTSMAELTSPSRATQRHVVRLALEKVRQKALFFRRKDDSSYKSCRVVDKGTREVLPLRLDSFRSWLEKTTGVQRWEPDFRRIECAVEHEALCNGTSFEPASYWTNRGHAVYVSSGRCRMVRIRPGQVDEMKNGDDDVIFDGAVLGEWKLLPVGQEKDPFTSCGVWSGMGTKAQDKLLFQAWAMGLPLDTAWKPPLLLYGEPGAGKTRPLEMLAALYGLPNPLVDINRTGRGDFWISVNHGGLVVLDNADTPIAWMPDAIATAATGGCDQRRRLYTNSATVRLAGNAWIGITAVTPWFLADPGLDDRVISIELASRPAGSTLAPERIQEEVMRNRDAGMSFMVRTLAAVLADRVPAPDVSILNKRFPGFAATAVKIGRAIQCEADVVAALRAVEERKPLLCVQNDEVGTALLRLMHDRSGAFEGHATQLFAALQAVDGTIAPPRWNAMKLGRWLVKMTPHLKQVFDWQVADDPKRGNVYRIAVRISMVQAVAGSPAAGSTSSPTVGGIGDFEPAEVPGTEDLKRAKDVAKPPKVPRLTKKTSDPTTRRKRAKPKGCDRRKKNPRATIR